MTSKHLLAQSCALLGISASLATVSAHAKPRDMTLYTLRVHIFKSDWNSDSMGGHGNGMANVIEGQTIHGADFVYTCTVRFVESVGNHAYVAKWKKPEKTIEVLGSPVGNPDKTSTCEFKVTLHDYVYDLQNGSLLPFTGEQYRIRQGVALPGVGVVDNAIEHYPLRLALLKIEWSPASNGSRTGSGRGNLQFPGGVSAIDFTSNCSSPFPPTPENRYYPVRWTTGGSEALLLLRTGGASGGALTCSLKTIVHSDVYVLDAAGAIKAVPLEEYRRLHSAPPPQP